LAQPFIDRVTQVRCDFQARTAAPNRRITLLQLARRAAPQTRRYCNGNSTNVRCFTAGLPALQPAATHAGRCLRDVASAARLARQGVNQMRIIADFPHCHC
jgi:hypothetical protein